MPTVPKVTRSSPRRSGRKNSLAEVTKDANTDSQSCTSVGVKRIRRSSLSFNQVECVDGPENKDPVTTTGVREAESSNHDSTDVAENAESAANGNGGKTTKRNLSNVSTKARADDPWLERNSGVEREQERNSEDDPKKSTRNKLSDRAKKKKSNHVATGDTDTSTSHPTPRTREKMNLPRRRTRVSLPAKEENTPKSQLDRSIGETKLAFSQDKKNQTLNEQSKSSGKGRREKSDHDTADAVDTSNLHSALKKRNKCNPPRRRTRVSVPEKLESRPESINHNIEPDANDNRHETTGATTKHSLIKQLESSGLCSEKKTDFVDARNVDASTPYPPSIMNEEKETPTMLIRATLRETTENQPEEFDLKNSDKHGTEEPIPNERSNSNGRVGREKSGKDDEDGLGKSNSLARLIVSNDIKIPAEVAYASLTDKLEIKSHSEVISSHNGKKVDQSKCAERKKSPGGKKNNHDSPKSESSSRLTDEMLTCPHCLKKLTSAKRLQNHLGEIFRCLKFYLL